MNLVSFFFLEHFQSLPEDDEVRKLVERSLEGLQQDDDRDVRFFSGGKVEEEEEEPSRSSELMDDEMSRSLAETTEYDNNHLYSQGGVRIIRRGIHEYAINDYDDEDSGLVEEVYIEEQSNDGLNEGDIVIEEYYVEKSDSSAEASEQIYVEEIIEEIIETVGNQISWSPVQN